MELEGQIEFRAPFTQVRSRASLCYLKHKSGWTGAWALGHCDGRDAGRGGGAATAGKQVGRGRNPRRVPRGARVLGGVRKRSPLRRDAYRIERFPAHRVPRRVKSRLLLCLLLVAAGSPGLLPAAEKPAPASDAEETDTTPETPDGGHSESLAERTLRDIVARQRDLFAKAEKDGAQFDEAGFHGEAQAIAGSYDVLIQKNPKFAAGYVAYGLFLAKVGMTRQGVAMLLTANRLDPDIALVKNELARHLAEDGKPIEALPYLMAAIDLEPKEPLYHFHLGELLLAARDDFILTGNFTRAGLEKAMLDAFRQAAELDPANLGYAYQYAKAFNDIDPPRWTDALALWEKLEHRQVAGTTMRELIAVQKAHALIQLGRKYEAREIIGRITDPKLADEKQTLLDQLAPKVEK